MVLWKVKWLLEFGLETERIVERIRKVSTSTKSLIKYLPSLTPDFVALCNYFVAQEATGR